MRSYVTVFRTRPAGDFLVRPYRLRRGSTRDARGISLISVLKNEYTSRIAAVVLEQLERFFEPVDDHEFDRSPEPPLQRYAASVTLEGDQLWFDEMRRLHGGHAGTGERWHLPREQAAMRLPAVLLEALGERREDVPQLLERLQSARAGRPTRR